MRELGLLNAGREGRGQVYRLNTDFPLYEELVAIFVKTRGSRRYRQALSPFAGMYR